MTTVHSPFEPRCGKVRHPSRRVAQVALNRSMRNHDRKGRDRDSLKIYFCSNCNGFHLGNNDEKTNESLATARRESRTRRERSTEDDDE